MTRSAVLAAAAGELIADKLHATPARTEPGPLAVRIAAGALAGGRIAGRRGASAGAIAAACSSFAADRARRAVGRRLDVPDPVIAVAEDVIAISLAVAIAEA